MLPIIERVSSSDAESIANRTFIGELAARFKLSESDRKERLSSGTQSRFENRVYWALVHLRRAGLIESTGRGLNRISQRGKDILAAKPQRIDLKLLSQFPEFREFRGTKPNQAAHVSEPAEAVASPGERIDAAFNGDSVNVAAIFLTRLAAIDPFRV